MKILIEFELDGYNTQDEMETACLQYVYEQLNMTASSIEILWSDKKEKEEI